MKEINDKKLALLELRRDPLFHKISSDQHEHYIDNSIEIGKEAAQQYKGKNIKELYEEHDIKITYSKRGNLVASFQLRAEFIQKLGNNEVILYKDSLEKLQVAWNNSLYISEKLTYSDIEEIHLAHEFHHFLEYNISSPVEKQLDPIIIKSIFGKNKKRYIIQCSEIASHAFAKELTRFHYFPTLLDIIFLESQGELNSTIINDLFVNNTLKGEF